MYIICTSAGDDNWISEHKPFQIIVIDKSGLSSLERSKEESTRWQ